MKLGLPHLKKLLASGKNGCCEAGLNTMTDEHETHRAKRLKDNTVVKNCSKHN